MSLDQDEVLPHSPARYTHWLVILAAAVLMNNLAWYAVSKGSVPGEPQEHGDPHAPGNRQQIEKTDTRDARMGPKEESQPSLSRFAMMPRWEIDVEGITHPLLCRPSDVLLADTEKVIGVVVDDEARAYVVKAFELKLIQSAEECGAHLVADSIAGQPIWVTHCDRTHSTRVFTSDPEKALPSVRVGGWSDGLMLKVGDRRFPQNDRSLPLSDAEYTVTSWQKWLKRHPETLVYTGNACSQASDSRAQRQ